MKKPNGPVDGDKGDRQQWVVDNREPADFQLDLDSHVLCQEQGGGLSNLPTSNMCTRKC